MPYKLNLYIKDNLWFLRVFLGVCVTHKCAVLLLFVRYEYCVLGWQKGQCALVNEHKTVYGVCKRYDGFQLFEIYTIHEARCNAIDKFLVLCANRTISTAGYLYTKLKPNILCATNFLSNILSAYFLFLRTDFWSWFKFNRYFCIVMCDL